MQENIHLRLVFHISQIDDTYLATMDSPDQGALDISVSSITFDGTSLVISVFSIGMKYKGTLSAEGIIKGTFVQGFTILPLNLERTEDLISPYRPQEPTKPYPYQEEDVTFENIVDGIILSGTLTMPNGAGMYPAVILISGSGAQNRNEEIMGHKPFLVLADYLTRNGFAVLRYDDRGVEESTGDFESATTADFANDVESAVKYLLMRNDINPRQIGLIGHSEGGVIASMVAARNNDMAFVVLMASPGIRGDKLLLMQQELIGRAVGMSENAIAENRVMHEQLFAKIVASSEPDTLQTGLTAWMLQFLKYDPATALERVKCPVLAINGDKDLQVPAETNLEAIYKALKRGNNQQVTIKQFSGLNHLFQECITGSPTEYGVIEQTISPISLDVITDWLKMVVKK